MLEDLDHKSYCNIQIHDPVLLLEDDFDTNYWNQIKHRYLGKEKAKKLSEKILDPRVHARGKEVKPRNRWFGPLQSRGGAKRKRKKMGFFWLGLMQPRLNKSTDKLPIKWIRKELKQNDDMDSKNFV